jgi:hypothetical protein
LRPRARTSPALGLHLRIDTNAHVWTFSGGILVNRRLPSAVLALLVSSALRAEPVSVRRTEGVVHGFLVLRTLEGTALADGDLIQFAHGDRVTSRVVFHFKDGSIHDETVEFSQRQRFQLLSDHLIQRGPSFPHPIESSIDAASGRVRVRYRDKDGEERSREDRLELPPDVSNGLMFTLLKNISPETPSTTVSMVAATPKPLLVKLVISPTGSDPFSIGSASHKANRYAVKIEIGGIAGVLAPLLGKKPPVTYVWILPGEAPTFVKGEGPLYFGGPVWRIELTSPVWPSAAAAR